MSDEWIQRKYPGVEVKARNLSDGYHVTATYQAQGFGVLSAAEVAAEYKRSPHRALYLMERLCRKVAFTAMQQAAVAVLRIVRPDWRGLWGLHTRIRFGEEVGTVIKCDYSRGMLTIQWPTGASDLAMAEALEHLARGEWRLD